MAFATTSRMVYANHTHIQTRALCHNSIVIAKTTHRKRGKSRPPYIAIIRTWKLRSYSSVSLYILIAHTHTRIAYIAYLAFLSNQDMTGKKNTKNNMKDAELFSVFTSGAREWIKKKIIIRKRKSRWLRIRANASVAATLFPSSLHLWLWLSSCGCGCTVARAYFRRSPIANSHGTTDR